MVIPGSCCPGLSSACTERPDLLPVQSGPARASRGAAGVGRPLERGPHLSGAVPAVPAVPARGRRRTARTLWPTSLVGAAPRAGGGSAREWKSASRSRARDRGRGRVGIGVDIRTRIPAGDMKRDVRILLLGEGRRPGLGAGRGVWGPRGRGEGSAWLGRALRALGRCADLAAPRSPGGKDVADPVARGRGVPRGGKSLARPHPSLSQGRDLPPSPGHRFAPSFPGPSPRRRDHHSRGRHPGEGAHPHCGLFR